MDAGLLKQEWVLITGAPELIFGGILALMLLLGGMYWLLFNLIYSTRIDTLKSQIDLREDRLKQAQEQSGEIAAIRKALAGTMSKLEAQIKANAPFDVLTNTSGAARSIVNDLGAAEDELTATVSFQGPSTNFSSLPSNWAAVRLPLDHPPSPTEKKPDKS